MENPGRDVAASGCVSLALDFGTAVGHAVPPRAGRAPSIDQLFLDGLTAQIGQDFPRAEACYRAVLRRACDHHAACQHLAMVLATSGRRTGALRMLRRKLRRFPEAAELWFTLGGMLHGLQRQSAAIAAVQRAAVIRPADPEIRNLLGVLLLEAGQPAQALAHLIAAADADPESADAHGNLGAALMALDRAQEALQHCERALRLRPDCVRIMRNLAAVFLALEREADSLLLLGKGAALAPADADIQHGMAIALMRTGKLVEATAALDRAIALRPAAARFYRARARLGLPDQHVTALEALTRDAFRRPVAERIDLHFALGAAYRGRGDAGRSMRHLITGNALKRRTIVYDEAATLGFLDRIREVFTADLIRRRSGYGHPTGRPIFIVGMPRSGSTLVEQIIASHPEVFGAGELRDFDETLAECMGGAGAEYPEAVLSLADGQLHALGDAYDRRLATRASTPRVTDKMLANFRHIGLIHLALPNARIIHVRRDPVACCLSCFAEIFAHAQTYSYDLAELGRCYRGYQNLMEHWRAVLPAGALIEVVYEDLIADPECQTRRLIAALDLPWDSACLAFHETRRPIRTASMAQVRQPIYRHAIKRPKRRQGYLRPLLDALEGR